jgi:hypothetical protein
MPFYVVNTNAQANGDHEIHTTECEWLPLPQHQDYLGYHVTCVTAVSAAKKKGYQRANGCFYCSRKCNTG